MRYEGEVTIEGRTWRWEHIHVWRTKAVANRIVRQLPDVAAIVFSDPDDAALQLRSELPPHVKSLSDDDLHALFERATERRFRDRQGNVWTVTAVTRTPAGGDADDRRAEEGSSPFSRLLLFQNGREVVSWLEREEADPLAGLTDEELNRLLERSLGRAGAIRLGERPETRAGRRDSRRGRAERDPSLNWMGFTGARARGEPGARPDAGERTRPQG